MSLSREERSPSPDGSASPGINPRHQRSRSRSRSPPPARSRSGSPVDTSNPGNNLYVTGLSTRVTNTDLEKFFSKEGKVLECCLVTDPRTKESRGFAFVTMETREQAERCIKYLHRSVLEGRLVSVEKAKRSRGRTPTPGRYQGLRKERGGPRGGGRGPRRRSRSFSPPRRRYDRGHYERDPYPRDRRGRSRSPYGRRPDDYPDSYRRRRERSVSAGRGGYP
ncbi:serine/arginine-rich splicing factor SR45a isoform X2 [Spinacia oleracea]|uniref:Serine/arginine-rich splicing factor SR45a isoform X2 n=1 Tax=Spinacia oleracea TaxID=3562 RepID=A0A9R0I9Q1_SPIOL|nr:serine/arginine-rich splicing factor SR45a-like isoform X2 [Spinacia oleracea]